ncbi:peptidase S10 [Rhodanobacter sp. AS-Z3]|uniref:S10 family peptidase n=1 Tax=Rhodanobacter sp. AS-Z3 TaxID=3031330 RepID=UPI00247A008D|nr:peptidase S10 [Rhodanobacter sp. AS-Z3]WEN15866.1 peptidase S10 [Rhodanobacter sp. AS-Z3]
MRHALLAPLALTALIGLAAPLHAADTSKHDAKVQPDKADKKAELPIPPEHSAVTSHSVTIDGRSIAYKATAGTLLIKDDKGKPTVSVFYVAYTVDGGKAANRPVTFLYNGGPGSSSMWLHMGSFGPVRVANQGDKPIPPPPYDTVPNQYSLLDKSDLVFIDAPGTGYSRLVGDAKGKDFYGIDQDAVAFAKFITRYVGDNHRWNSPKFLFGESYGTTRSAVLAQVLQEQGMELNGIVLMSSILDFNVWSTTGVDHAYIVNLPTEAAIAWYHNKVPNKPADIASFIDGVRRFASTDYMLALAKGDALSPAEADRIADQLNQYTGLSTSYIKQANLRIDPSRFRKELLRDQRRTVGRLDGRFEGIDGDAAGETPDGDAASDAATGAYNAAFNQYIDGTLHYSSDDAYLPNNYPVVGRSWDWKRKGQQFTSSPYVGRDLATAMRQNPHLKVFSANGYYDLATPFYATEFDLGHLGLDPAIRKNIEFGFYQSGHMIYFDVDALKQVKADLARFYDEATPHS